MKMNAVVGLYADGVYLALDGQNSKALGVPNLSDLVRAFPEIRVLAHEPSLMERGLFSQSLIESVELVDEERFLEEIMESNSVILL